MWVKGLPPFRKVCILVYMSNPHTTTHAIIAAFHTPAFHGGTEADVMMAQFTGPEGGE